VSNHFNKLKSYSGNEGLYPKPGSKQEQSNRNRAMLERALLSKTSYKNGKLVLDNEQNRNVQERISKLVETFVPNEQINYKRLLSDAEQSGEKEPEVAALKGMRDLVMAGKRLGEIDALLKSLSEQKDINDIYDSIRQLVKDNFNETDKLKIGPLFQEFRETRDGGEGLEAECKSLKRALTAISKLEAAKDHIKEIEILLERVDKYDDGEFDSLLKNKNQTLPQTFRESAIMHIRKEVKHVTEEFGSIVDKFSIEKRVNTLIEQFPNDLQKLYQGILDDSNKDSKIDKLITALTAVRNNLTDSIKDHALKTRADELLNELESKNQDKRKSINDGLRIMIPILTANSLSRSPRLNPHDVEPNSSDVPDTSEI